MNTKIRRWIYDYEDDHDNKDHNCIFIGTEKDFDEMRKIVEDLWGAWTYNIREEDPTDEELEEYTEQ